MKAKGRVLWFQIKNFRTIMKVGTITIHELVSDRRLRRKIKDTRLGLILNKLLKK